MAVADHYKTVQEIYIAYYQRPADPAGLVYWAEQLDAVDGNLDAIIDAFAGEAESQELYGDINADTIGDVIDAIYQAAFGRAPDAAGKQFYIDAFNNGTFTAGQIALAVVQSTEGDDVAVIANKIAAADLFTDAVAGVDRSDADYGKTTPAATYDGAADADAARGFLNGVTTTAPSAGDVESFIKTEIADEGDKILEGTPGETNSLTKGAETLTGTANNDVIEGVASTLASERTLDAEDKIDGGDGNDTLKVEMKGNFTGFTKDKGYLKNVETVELSNAGTTERTFTATGVEGVEKYVLDGQVSLANLANTEATISISNRDSGTAKIGFATDVTKGTSDELSVVLNALGKVKATPAADHTRVTVDAAGIETFNFEAEGDNYIQLSGNGAVNVNATGAGSLDVKAVGTGLKTFDASGVEGKVVADLTDVTTAGQITAVAMGQQDSTVAIDAADLRANAEITGGAGNDTLKISGAATTTQFSMSGVENIELGGLTGALLFSATNTEGVEKVVVNGNPGAGATFANLGEVDMTVQLKGAAAVQTISLDNAGAATLVVDTPATGATDAAPSENKSNVTFSKAATLDATVAGKMNYTGTIDAAKAESVTLAVQGKTTAAVLSAAAATSIVISEVANASTLNVSAAKVEELTVNAAEALSLAGSTLSGVQVLTVDTAKAFTGVALGDLSVAELSGNGSVGLGNIGSSTMDHSVDINASGLAANTATGNVALKIDAITTKDQNITVNAAEVLGKVTLGAINAGAANVTVNVDGTGGDISLAAITGKNVTIDAAGALGAMTYGGIITVGDTLTFKGSALKTNVVSTIDVDGANVKLNLEGGIETDAFTVTSFATSGAQKVTVAGDLGLGTDSLTFNLAGHATGAVDINVKDLVGVEAVTVTGVVATMAGSNFTYTGGAGSDVIDLSSLAIAHTAGKVVIDLGANDGASDQVKFGSAMAATDSSIANKHFEISGFEAGTTGSDVISFQNGLLEDAGGSTTGVSKVNEFAKGGFNATAFTATAGNMFYEVSGTGDVAAGKGTDAAEVWEAIIGTGSTVGGISSTAKLLFIVDDGTDSFLWYFSSSDTVASSDDITLIGVVKGVTDFADGDLSVV